MKHVFPSKITLEVPKLPNLSADRDAIQDEVDDVLSQDGIKACSYVILEWAHKLLENKFETLKELACHLVESKLVDARSFGAFTVLSLAPNAGKSNSAAALLNQSGGNKHRDTQLQLQRKIQEKGMIKEQKKRLNDIRGDKIDAKERRRASSGPCARSMRSSSSVRSAQVCSMPSTPLPATSDSPPESKPTTPIERNVKKDAKIQNGHPEPQRKAGKVQIPRITNRQSPKVCIAQSVPASIILLPQLTPIGDLKTKPKPKYKPIQPKPTMIHDQNQTQNGKTDAKRTKNAVKRPRLDEESEKPVEKTFDDDTAHESRDVLLSQSSCDPPKMSEKELTEMLGDDDHEHKTLENGTALMDFMEGSSASMEQDEELSQYFSEPITTPTTPTKRNDVNQSAQLTQLRWLLEHNLKPSPPAAPPSWPQNNSSSSSSSHTLRQLLSQPAKSDVSVDSLESQPLPSMEMLTGYSLSQHAAENQAPDQMVKRRVSFPINLNESANLDSVPPSPNTRCRSFNFTPISPRHTPLPLMSQPASATASPFMSPSGTPVPLSRSRHNSGQAVSSYATTPRTTPYPSEHSSTVNSPFISPHPTPVPFNKSRTAAPNQIQRILSFSSSGAQQISPNTHALNLLNPPARQRPLSGAMTLVSPRSAPLSPINYIDTELNNNNNSQFSMPTVGDTPQLRSRNNSNSSIPPASPCSAPMSPQTNNNGLFLVQSMDAQGSNMDWTQNATQATQGYSTVGGTWYQNAMSSNDPRILARQRHTSVHQTSSMDLMGQSAAMRMMLQRSNSVPVSHMPRHVTSTHGTDYSYPATPTAAIFTDLINPAPAPTSAPEAEQFCSRKNLTSPQSYDLGTTLEDLRACDDAYSQFAQEFEHQSPPKSAMMLVDDDVFPSKTF
uniref:Uncharacterized protein n=1 Tax=Strigamia maritima TaxID=126957 RepID=T1JJF2_STRMM